MAPALIHLHNCELCEPSTSTFAREIEAMKIQPAFYPRSIIETNSTEGGGSGLGENTIIFIVLGVVCLLVILIGFYLVSRPRVASNTSPNGPSFHLQHSPIHSPCPRRQRDLSERWKLWKTWRHTNGTRSTASETPISQLSPAPPAITRPSRFTRVRGSSKTYPPITSRPSQDRRITSLSVATSFSHSHITEEALSDFRASAYDLDGDLETEMLHSARDDVWPGHPLAVEDGCGDVIEESIEAQGNVTPVVETEGSVEGDAPTTSTTQWRGDYENTGACQREPSTSHSQGAGGDMIEVDKMVMGQAL